MTEVNKLNECYDLLQQSIDKLDCEATTIESCRSDKCKYYGVCNAILKAQESISRIFLNGIERQ